MINKPFQTIVTVKEIFQYFRKIFKKMLKMSKSHLFSLIYVYMLKGNIPK